MMLQQQDMKLLRWPILGALLLIAIGAGALALSERQLDAARKLREQLQKQGKTAQERVSKASEEEKEIRNHLVYYQRMLDSGMVGPRNRLDLIETISGIKSQRKLLDIRYNIAPQKPVDYTGIVATGSMDFVTSRMQLDMMLLHEEDLLNFVRDLQAAGQSLVSVRQCTLVRSDRGMPVGLAPGVQARCVIDLITLIQGSPSG